MGSTRGPCRFRSAPSEVDSPSLRTPCDDCHVFRASDRVAGMTGLDLLPPGQRRLFIGGSWRDAAEDEVFDVLDPADGSVLAQVADGTVADAVDALDAAVEAQPSWAATPPRDRGEILRSAFELIRRPSRRPRPPDEPRDGQDGQGGQGRGRLRQRVLPLVRRGGGAHPRPLDAGARGRQPAAHHQEAGGSVPLRHALELPDRDGHPQDRPGRRRRLHDGRQAGPADAADDARAGRDPGRGGAARRRAQRRARRPGPPT